MRSNETSRITDVREMSESGRQDRSEHGGRPSDAPRMNVNQLRTERPKVMGVPLETVQTAPHWTPQSPEAPAAAQPLLGTSQPLLTAGRPVPINMGSGRIPEGGGNASIKQKSVFESPRGAGSQVNEVRLLGNGPRLQQLQVAQAAQGGVPPPPPAAPHEYRRAIGQATPVEPQYREAEIERIIERQLPPQGMTKKEAQQLADALTVALDVSEKALAAGEKCFGVDDASIAQARATRDYLANFAYSAGASDRTDPAKLPKEKLDTVERILECQMAHERLVAQNSPSVLALLAAGVVVVGVTYLVVKTL